MSNSCGSTSFISVCGASSRASISRTRTLWTSRASLSAACFYADFIATCAYLRAIFPYWFLMHYTSPSTSLPRTPKSPTFPFPTYTSPSAINQYRHTSFSSPPTRYTTADKSYPSSPCATAGFSAAVHMNDTFRSATGSAPRSSSSYIVGASGL